MEDPKTAAEIKRKYIVTNRRGAVVVMFLTELEAKRMENQGYRLDEADEAPATSGERSHG